MLVQSFPIDFFLAVNSILFQFLLIVSFIAVVSNPFNSNSQLNYFSIPLCCIISQSFLSSSQFNPFPILFIVSSIPVVSNPFHINNQFNPFSNPFYSSLDFNSLYPPVLFYTYDQPFHLSLCPIVSNPLYSCLTFHRFQFLIASCCHLYL